MHIQPTRSYRCHYHPLDRDGYPLPAESGVLPYIQLQAADAEQAQQLAHHTTGAPISRVERLDEVMA